MSVQISINNLSKVYDNGFEALKKINLNIKKGEIFAMLGPNGAGKTTLISVVFPAPFGPSIAKISPFLIFRFIFFNASKPLSYTFDRLFMLI